MQLDPGGATAVLAVLDALELRHGVPRIEAAERRRLAAYAAGTGDSSSWTPNEVDGWYLGLYTGPAGRVGEAGRLDGGPVTAPLAVATAAGATRVWLRGTDPTDVAGAAGAGWTERRRLSVLGRSLTDLTTVPTPPGLRLAPLTEVGGDAVAALLDHAYAGPRRAGLVEAAVEAGPWTGERFARVAAVALAAPEDLLLAVDATGALVGAHWTGRRAGGVGEVFNLAVDPDHGGRRVGAWLLAAGLAHLAALGLRAVVLWVDRANAPARALYARAGFTERGWDVALER